GVTAPAVLLEYLAGALPGIDVTRARLDVLAIGPEPGPVGAVAAHAGVIARLDRLLRAQSHIGHDVGLDHGPPLLVVRQGPVQARPPRGGGLPSGGPRPPVQPHPRDHHGPGPPGAAPPLPPPHHHHRPAPHLMPWATSPPWGLGSIASIGVFLVPC